MALPDDLLALRRGAAPGFVATMAPDGSPQLTQTWVDTDGEHVVVPSARLVVTVAVDTVRPPR